MGPSPVAASAHSSGCVCFSNVLKSVRPVARNEADRRRRRGIPDFFVTYAAHVSRAPLLCDVKS